MLDKFQKIIFIIAMLALCVVIVKIYSALPAFIEKINAQKVETKPTCDIDMMGKCYKITKAEDWSCGGQAIADSLGKQPINSDSKTHCQYDFTIDEVKR